MVAEISNAGGVSGQSSGAGSSHAVELPAHPLPVVARHAAEAPAEGAEKGLVALETALQCDVEHVRVVHQQAEGAALQPEARRVGLRRLPDRRLEEALQVERREPRLPAQRIETEVPLQVGLDVDQQREQRLPVPRHAGSATSLRAALRPPRWQARSFRR